AGHAPAEGDGGAQDGRRSERLGAQPLPLSTVTRGRGTVPRFAEGTACRARARGPGSGPGAWLGPGWSAAGGIGGGSERAGGRVRGRGLAGGGAPRRDPGGHRLT